MTKDLEKRNLLTNSDKAKCIDDEDDSTVDFNVILKAIGDLGRYQLLLVLIVYTVTMPAGINMVGSVFLEATPTHRCALPSIDNHPKLYHNVTEQQIKNYTIPWKDSTNVSQHWFLVWL